MSKDYLEIPDCFNKYRAEFPYLLGGGMNALLLLILDDNMIK